ncbi:hypothetical protein TTHERM_000249759 (macronuclear) [Tetrahymena thermophila SB210]|uniref:Uncharacterized protein n=1 Tax=Tetrahymena thermophila (strain SB210) TaxID=312017 RepID=W7X8B8_TETTS|nr:hypothetical protein TTHERM_000249759 [Tetrahymena thermophila SB210]EWS73597.1 hypothetical protein TTHERM_000249759 [Tetrahymena thermophila SB210]|eukprot:XP_012653827.1 hypothetical protein TTHERM_000249759 [Tetrahymena thermophila SB210]
MRQKGQQPNILIYYKDRVLIINEPISICYFSNQIHIQICVILKRINQKQDFTKFTYLSFDNINSKPTLLNPLITGKQ